MEKETINLIGCLLTLVLLIGCLCIGFYALHVTSSSKKAEKSNSALVLDGSMKYTPYDKPFEELWNASGCSVHLHMDGMNLGRFNINDIRRAHGLPQKTDIEAIYRDAILKLVKDGLAYRRMGDNNSELRKFCIEQVGVFRPLGNCIRDAKVLYEYIAKGCQTKDKEVEA